MNEKQNGLSMLLVLAADYRSDLIKLCLTLTAIICLTFAFVSESTTDTRIIIGALGMLLLGLRMSAEPGL